MDLDLIKSYKESLELLYGLQRKINSLNAELKSKDSITTELNRKIDSLNAELKSKDSIITELNSLTALNRCNSFTVSSMQSEIEGLKAAIDNLQHKNKELKLKLMKQKLIESVLQESENNTSDTMEETDIEEQFKYDIKSSEKWLELYDSQVERSKQLVKDKLACICNANWAVDGSRAKGKKMTEDGIKIALMSFDTIVDRACNYVTSTNYDKLRHKVKVAFDKINRLNYVNQISITHEYLTSKLSELETMHKYRIMKQDERDKAKEIRRKAAEEKREKERLEAEEKKLQLELDRQRQIEESARLITKQQLEENTKLLEELHNKGEEVGKLESLVAELQSKLEESEKNQQLAEEKLIEQIVDIQDKKETLQAGFVYIISNYGAFGENVFKIGVTRRADPLERINELGNASVPFRFNVHAIIPSEEAFKLEHRIHQRLRKYRVNLVNNRKEFFKIDINELQDILSELVDNIEFNFEITEEQYLETCQIRNNPDEFDKWVNSYQEVTNDDDEEKQYKMLGIVDISALSNNKNYISIEEYENYYNSVVEILEGLSSKPVMRVTKYYVAVYLALENNMKKLITFYKNGDGRSVSSFSVKGYTGEETSGQRKSISIDKFDIEKYSKDIMSAAIEIDNQLIDLSSINI
ncbi:MAG: DUF4041 domain-containing protein [Acholeplasmatales bacterium]|nr:DUF4041 domain-containing protein [Acholeplasmatales bacterium]